MNASVNSVAELVLGYEAHKDYQVHMRDRGADVTITAIHGGRIEPLTSELAQAIAGNEHNLYELRGLLAADNAALRIPTARFNEIRLNALVRRSLVCLALDGVPGSRELVHLGGKNSHLKAILAEQLAQAGFEVAAPYSVGAAHDPTRYYNASREGGILLELSETLRTGMVNVPLAGIEWQQPSTWLSRFFQFTAAINSALVTYLEAVQSDVGRAMEYFEETTERIPKSLHPEKHRSPDD